MVKTSDFESENSGSSPDEAASWNISGNFVVVASVDVYESDFGALRGPPSPKYVSPEERAALRALAIIKRHDLGISPEKTQELADSIAAEIALDLDWAEIERLATGEYSLCDGYCNEEGAY